MIHLNTKLLFIQIPTVLWLTSLVQVLLTEIWDTRFLSLRKIKLNLSNLRHTVSFIFFVLVIVLYFLFSVCAFVSCVFMSPELLFSSSESVSTWLELSSSLAWMTCNFLTSTFDAISPLLLATSLANSILLVKSFLFGKSLLLAKSLLFAISLLLASSPLMSSSSAASDNDTSVSSLAALFGFEAFSSSSSMSEDA